MLQRLKTFFKAEVIRRRFLRHAGRGYVDLKIEEVEWVIDNYESMRYFLAVAIGWYIFLEGELLNGDKTRYYYKINWWMGDST